MPDSVDKLAKIIWDYHHMQHQLQKSDCIVVLGSQDTRVAERGAQLLLEGWAPLIVFSGGFGRITKNIWKETEAEKFKQIALAMGVPPDKILVEDTSTNTGENITSVRKLLENKSIDIKRIIAVHKPYMERRTYATFKKLWPEIDVLVTSPQIAYENYPTAEISEEDVINIMVGDLQRIKLYPEMGFQISQVIPDKVWSAYEQLVALGYSKCLIRK
ncbi:MAG: YdcF family protein [Patescibacteria group bacterium]|jgi:uncharacterized SAM-binding protein YcdF (DUF218 family)